MIGIIGCQKKIKKIYIKNIFIGGCMIVSPLDFCKNVYLTLLENESIGKIKAGDLILAVKQIDAITKSEFGFKKDFTKQQILEHLANVFEEAVNTSKIDLETEEGREIEEILGTLIYSFDKLPEFLLLSEKTRRIVEIAKFRLAGLSNPLVKLVIFIKQKALSMLMAYEKMNYAKRSIIFKELQKAVNIFKELDKTPEKQIYQVYRSLKWIQEKWNKLLMEEAIMNLGEAQIKHLENIVNDLLEILLGNNLSLRLIVQEKLTPLFTLAKIKELPDNFFTLTQSALTSLSKDGMENITQAMLALLDARSYIVDKFNQKDVAEFDDTISDLEKYVYTNTEANVRAEGDEADCSCFCEIVKKKIEIEIKKMNMSEEQRQGLIDELSQPRKEKETELGALIKFTNEMSQKHTDLTVVLTETIEKIESLYMANRFFSVWQIDAKKALEKCKDALEEFGSRVYQLKEINIADCDEIIGLLNKIEENKFSIDTSNYDSLKQVETILKKFADLYIQTKPKTKLSFGKKFTDILDEVNRIFEITQEVKSKLEALILEKSLPPPPSSGGTGETSGMVSLD